MDDPRPAGQDEKRPLSAGLVLILLGLVLNAVWLVGGVLLVGYTLVAIWQ